MKRLLDIAYDCGEKNKLDAYLPEGKEFPIIVYFHGGWKPGTRATKIFGKSGRVLLTADTVLYR